MHIIRSLGYWTSSGKEKIRGELVFVPARMFLRRHIAEVVKCTSCGMDEAMDAELPDIEKCYICTAEVPSPMIPHSFCTPGITSPSLAWWAYYL